MQQLWALWEAAKQAKDWPLQCDSSNVLSSFPRIRERTPVSPCMSLRVYLPKKTVSKARTDAAQNMLQRQKQTDAPQKTWFNGQNRRSTRESTVDGYYARAGKDENKEIKIRCRPSRCTLVYAHASSLSSAVELVIMIMSPKGVEGMPISRHLSPRGERDHARSLLHQSLTIAASFVFTGGQLH